MNFEDVDGRTEMDLADLEESLVCRRVVRNGMVVAALHPVAGPVYWWFTDESDCNAPDSYGITGDLELATVFKSGYYRGRSFESFRFDCLAELSEFEEVWDGESDEFDVIEKHSWEVEKLAAKANCTPKEVSNWLYNAAWVEYPAPVRTYFLSDFNGFLGYSPEWSQDVEDALRWSKEALADQDDLDVTLARSIGHFVDVCDATAIEPVARSVSVVNHPLEADYLFTLHRLGIGRSRDWKRKSSGIASWRGDLRESAWIHAARAGVDHALSEQKLEISGHIAAFPELLERFEMAVALARWEASVNSNKSVGEPT